jgi:hypothetical protein
MTKLAMIGAACLAAALATASPALARDGHGGGGGFHGGGFHGGGFHRGGFGVVPGIAAGVIAGAALGSYGAYGPGYYDDSYAYDNGNGYNRIYDEGYAARNGFVCRPGTWFRGEDGRPHLCQ